MACTDYSYQVSVSNSIYPVRNTFVLTKIFCHIVKKIDSSCKTEIRVTLELAYPNICSDIETIHKYESCKSRFRPESITEWNKEKADEFAQMIFKYTQENIIPVNIYLKDPFAIRYLIDENASR